METLSTPKPSAGHDVHPNRKILVVVTVGGSTNCAPILEICSILASRGHTIEFATLGEREGLVASYPFVSAVHIVGRAIPAAEDEERYLRFSRWDATTWHGRREILQGRKYFDSFWPETYRALKGVVEQHRPDFIFADYNVTAAIDVSLDYCIPLATMWPLMPWLMVPHKWIPGDPWQQTRCLTSEKASMYDRLYEQTVLLRNFPHLIDLYLWTRKMRLATGVKTMPPLKKKPDYLLFVNTFFGLEPAKDLPPLLQAVGPILSDTFPSLDDQTEKFLAGKGRVVYVAFGTHVILTGEKLDKVISGLALALLKGHIDGVIWAIRPAARKQMDTSKGYPVAGDADFTLGDLLANRHPAWLFLEYVAQRAVLDHPSTRVFLTHAGPSSANEALYHGVPMISMPVYGDQLQYSMRLVAAGVALSINKDHFSPAELCALTGTILHDQDGQIRRNVQRMRRIANVAARRKHLAADLVEEHLYDWGLRYEFDPNETPQESNTTFNGGRGTERSPMHLQTADARMSWIRANNIDEYLVALALCLAIALVIILSVVLS